jgi:hypothetical protein
MPTRYTPSSPQEIARQWQVTKYREILPVFARARSLRDLGLFLDIRVTFAQVAQAS